MHTIPPVSVTASPPVPLQNDNQGDPLQLSVGSKAKYYVMLDSISALGC